MTDKSTCEELAEALRPFADIATAYEKADAIRQEHRADAGLSTYDRSDHHRISCELGDLRRAAEALSKYEAERAAAIRQGAGL
jgi:hypothetical protein